MLDGLRKRTMKNMRKERQVRKVCHLTQLIPFPHNQHIRRNEKRFSAKLNNKHYAAHTHTLGVRCCQFVIHFWSGAHLSALWALTHCSLTKKKPWPVFPSVSISHSSVSRHILSAFAVEYWGWYFGHDNLSNTQIERVRERAKQSYFLVYLLLNGILYIFITSLGRLVACSLLLLLLLLVSFFR